MSAAEYMCRIGTWERRDRPRDLYAIPFREAPDDGQILIAGGAEPTCIDCRRGKLTWAEAGYVAWHRICSHCGSHWDLHLLFYVQWKPEGTWYGSGRQGAHAPVASIDPDPRLPAGLWHTELLRTALAIGAVRSNGREGSTVATASWARRARFYGGAS